MVKNLEQYFNDYRQLRVSLGYAQHPHYPVREFIGYLLEKYPESDIITKEMFDSWLNQRAFHSHAGHADAITRIRMFLRYLRSVSGKDVFIPGDDYSVIKVKPYPYIYTDDELKRLFKAIDSFPPDSHSPMREYIVPVLFRMMYCCGMRPQEPASIRKEDFNLDTGEIYIRQSKRQRDRRIVISDDLLSLCRKYAGGVHTEIYFLERLPGEKLNTCWVDRQFNLAWGLSGLEKRGANPRPYDFRHNFSTRTIIRWLDEGRDVHALMPFLSAYLGHATLDSTLYYIHLVPENLLKSRGIDWSRFQSLYQEVTQ